MNKQNIILVLQVLFSMLQVVNASELITKDPKLGLIVAAFMVGIQTALQHIGNQSIPEKIKADIALAKTLNNLKPILLIMIGAGLAISAHAQVEVLFTPEPMAVPTAVLANAKGLGRWKISFCNNGSSRVLIPIERIDMASGPISLVDADDAMLVLSAAQKRSFAQKLVTGTSIAGEAAALALAIASKANAGWATGIGLGAGLLPGVSKIAMGQVPSYAPLISSAKYPVSLDPGQCFTDHRFAAKMKQARAFTAVIPAEQLTMLGRAKPIEEYNIKGFETYDGKWIEIASWEIPVKSALMK